MVATKKNKKQKKNQKTKNKKKRNPFCMGKWGKKGFVSVEELRR
jgi:hypothetical protein